MVYLKRIQLKQFRNYLDQSIDFSPTKNIIFGPNGQGKTNLLEAIYFLTTGRSAVTPHQTDLILSGVNDLWLEGVFSAQWDSHVAIQLNRQGQKWIKIDRKKISKSSDLLGRFPVVFLLPKDIEVVQAGPDKRRSFLNEVLCQFSKAYSEALTQYQELVKQKNVLLRESKIFKKKLDSIVFESFNEAMLEPARILFQTRKKLVEQLQTEVQNLYQNLYPVSHSVKLTYMSDVGAKVSDEEYVLKFKELLLRSVQQEIIKGRSLVGPLRDDFLIELSGKNARYFASHGQKRLLSISLRLAAGLTFQAEKKPIYLIDDVLLELDLEHQAAIQSYFSKNQQVFLAVTHLEKVPSIWAEKARLIQVESGNAAITSS